MYDIKATALKEVYREAGSDLLFSVSSQLITAVVSQSRLNLW